MRQFAVLIYADDSAHVPGSETTAKAQCDAHAEEMAARSMTWAYALTPRSMAVTVTADGPADRPFMGELPIVAGFYILEADDLDGAVAMAATNPVVLGGGGVEVRPVHSGGAVDRQLDLEPDGSERA